MLAARRLDRLTELAETCRSLGVTCETRETNVQDHAQVHGLVKETIQKYGRIDVLINNAGMGSFGAFQSQSWENIQQTLRTNLEGVLDLSHAVIPHMIQRKAGTIVNVSSVVGKRTVPNLAAYCASKFGVWGFSRSLAEELRPHSIHVCHFCPTATATEFHEVAGMNLAGSSPIGLDSPDRVAQALVEAVVRRKSEHIMSVTERILIKLYLIAPGLTERLLNLVRKKE